MGLHSSPATEKDLKHRKYQQYHCRIRHPDLRLCPPKVLILGNFFQAQYFSFMTKAQFLRADLDNAQ